MPRIRDAENLKKRPAFLAIASERFKWVTPGLILQAGPVGASLPRALQASYIVSPENPCRYGLTTSKKVGGAVVRNRARRRLRALVAEILAPHARRTHAYVLIGRPATVTRSYADLARDLETALRRLKLWEEGA